VLDPLVQPCVVVREEQHTSGVAVQPSHGQQPSSHCTRNQILHCGPTLFIILPTHADKYTRHFESWVWASAWWSRRTVVVTAPFGLYNTTHLSSCCGRTETSSPSIVMRSELGFTRLPNSHTTRSFTSTLVASAVHGIRIKEDMYEMK
jgi:hypothetical protein